MKKQEFTQDVRDILNFRIGSILGQTAEDYVWYTQGKRKKEFGDNDRFEIRDLVFKVLQDLSFELTVYEITNNKLFSSYLYNLVEDARSYFYGTTPLRFWREFSDPEEGEISMESID